MSTNSEHRAPVKAVETYETLRLTAREGGARFSIHAKPRASRSALLGVREGVLDVALAAPPVDGAANEELADLLSEILAIRKRDVAIVAGSTGRSKVVEVPLSPEETRKRLSAWRGGPSR